MRDYGRISVSLWMSRKFRSLRSNDQARLLYLYLHTCPQANSIGCFALPKGYAASDLGWNDRAINRAIEALTEASLIAWNEGEELVRITGFLEHSPLTNLKHAKGAIKLALALPECDEKVSVCNDLLADSWAKNDDDLKRASIGLSEPSDTTETETETDKTSSLRSDVGDTAPVDVETVKSKRATRLPADWSPADADRAYALSKGFREDEINDLRDEFRDYWAGVPGQRGLNLDWSGAWRNNVRKQAERRGRQALRPSGAGDRRGPASFAEAAMRVAARRAD